MGETLDQRLKRLRAEEAAKIAAWREPELAYQGEAEARRQAELQEAEQRRRALDAMAGTRIVPILETVLNHYLDRRGEISVSPSDDACGVWLRWGEHTTSSREENWSYGSRLGIVVTASEYLLYLGEDRDCSLKVAISDPNWRELIEDYTMTSLASALCGWRTCTWKYPDFMR